jgi:hypothetical protein
VKKFIVESYLELRGTYRVTVESESAEAASELVEDSSFNPFEYDASIEDFLQNCTNSDLEVIDEPEEE